MDDRLIGFAEKPITLTLGHPHKQLYVYKRIVRRIPYLEGKMLKAGASCKDIKISGVDPGTVADLLHFVTLQMVPELQDDHPTGNDIEPMTTRYVKAYVLAASWD